MDETEGLSTRANALGQINSRNYTRYLPDLECLFNLVVPESKRIKLEFLGPIDVTVNI